MRDLFLAACLLIAAAGDAFAATPQEEAQTLERAREAIDRVAGDLLQLVEFSPAPPALDVEIAARFQVSVAALSDTLAAVTMLHTLDNFVSCDQKTKRGVRGFLRSYLELADGRAALIDRGISASLRRVRDPALVAQLNTIRDTLRDDVHPALRGVGVFPRRGAPKQ